jgi:hypothetical protein
MSKSGCRMIREVPSSNIPEAAASLFVIR